MRAPTRWLRANRLWLPLVPVAFVAMLAGASYNVHHWWWEQDLRRVDATARPGHFVLVDMPYTDTEGPTAYRFQVRLNHVSELPRRSAVYDLDHVPASAVVDAVHLDLAAPPSMPISDCYLALVDDHGRRYGDPSDPVDQPYTCIPENHTGPTPALVKGQKRGAVAKGQARPPTWSTTTYVVVPKDVHITAVNLWYYYPDYVELPVDSVR